MFARARTRMYGRRERKSRGEGEKEISEKQDEEINLYEVLINVNPT